MEQNIEKHLEEMHLKAFLENREMPQNLVDAIFATPLAPARLFEIMFSIHVSAERIGMNLNGYTQHDIQGAKRDFIYFISA